MEHNRSSKFESIISVQSQRSNRSFSKSLGRQSWQIPNPSTDNKASLVYVMSIQSDNRKSDIFQGLLDSQKKPKYRTSNIVNGQYMYDSQNQYNQFKSQIQRNSDRGGEVNNQIQIDHQCRCYDDCYGQQCPCFQAKNEMCIKRTCCIRCVQLKTMMFYGHSYYNQPNNQHIHNHSNYSQNVYGIRIENQTNYTNNENTVCNCKNTQCLKSYCKCFQNGQFCSQNCGCQSCKNKQHSQQRQIAIQAIKSNNQIIYCTCKKTKCNKKYCSCYASGVKCGKHCSCQNCTNCVKNNDMDIEVYEGSQEEDLGSLVMPERMSFQKAILPGTQNYHQHNS